MLTFSPVVYIPHEKNEIVEEIIKIVTITGKAIKLTRTHMILSGECDSDLKLVMAKEVKIGYCVLTIEGFLSVTLL
jgi:intein/homing endonuclease